MRRARFFPSGGEKERRERKKGSREEQRQRLPKKFPLFFSTLSAASLPPSSLCVASPRLLVACSLLLWLVTSCLKPSGTSGESIAERKSRRIDVEKESKKATVVFFFFVDVRKQNKAPSNLPLEERQTTPLSPSDGVDTSTLRQRAIWKRAQRVLNDAQRDARELLSE